MGPPKTFAWRRPYEIRTRGIARDRSADRSAARLLIATDFDGTLCPLAPSPVQVHLSAGMLEILRQIAACKRLTLAVISGRALGDVARRIPESIVVAGNHGLEIAGPGVAFHHAAADARRPLLERACAELDTALARFPGAWVERKGLSATVHYRWVELRAHGAVRLATRVVLAPYGRKFALRAGNRALKCGRRRDGKRDQRR